MKISNNYLSFLILLFCNVIYLYIGGLSTRPGVQSEWYQTLSQAPWTPPGFVFGLAWSIIAITFAVFGAKTWQDPELMYVYFISWMPNISWNIIFFEYHQIHFALATIVVLSGMIGSMIYTSRKKYNWTTTVWLIPYFTWLIVATSLNLWISIKN